MALLVGTSAGNNGTRLRQYPKKQRQMPRFRMF